MHKLFNSRDVKILSKIVKFINIVNYKVCTIYVYNLLSYLDIGGTRGESYCHCTVNATIGASRIRAYGPS